MSRLVKLDPLRRLFRKLLYIFPSSHYALLSLFYFTGLEVIYALHRWPFFLISIVLLVLVIGIILIRIEERGGFHPTQAILPTLAVFSMTSFALFLPGTMLLHLYFVLCALILFFLLKHGARFAYPTWNWVLSLVILFTAVASILGWRFHFYAPITALVIGVFIVIALVSLQSLQRFEVLRHEKLMLALSIAFVLTQIAWALQFLPFHFIVQTGIIVALYYAIFQLTALSCERKLTKRDILEYVFISGVGVTILLFSARWA